MVLVITGVTVGCAHYIAVIEFCIAGNQNMSRSKQSGFDRPGELR